MRESPRFKKFEHTKWRWQSFSCNDVVVCKAGVLDPVNKLVPPDAELADEKEVEIAAGMGLGADLTVADLRGRGRHRRARHVRRASWQSRPAAH